MRDAHAHWESVYAAKPPEQVSWYRPHLETSLSLIHRSTGGARSASIIDVGGGTSTLVDDLVNLGYGNLTVLDISQTAIDKARKRLGGGSGGAIRWIQADVTQFQPPKQAFDVWHDRAVFHFLTRPSDRRAYVLAATAALKPGGYAIVSTFGPEGPTKCSGLDVVRYDEEALHSEFGRRFRLVDSSSEEHETPFGAKQQFLYCYCRLDFEG